MKKNITFAIIATLLMACQKEINNEFGFIPPKDESTLNDFFNRHKTEPKSFSMDVTQPINLVGKQGSLVRFQANAFVKKNGEAVTGNVNIELLEIYTPVEMILNNKPTMSNGLPLSSGGEFFVKVTQNGEELKLAPGKIMGIQMQMALPADSMPGMQVFNGQVNMDSSVNWVANNNQSNTVRPNVDSAGLYGYELFADSVQWINCDRFITEPLISQSFDVSAAPDDSVVAIYVHLTSRNSVLRIYERDDDLFKTEKLVAGDATIIAISIKDDQIYASFVPIKLADKGHTKFVFEPITEDALKQRLQLLQ